MPVLKVQDLGGALYICIPAELTKVDPPLLLHKGDELYCERVADGFLYRPVSALGSVWRLMPVECGEEEGELRPIVLR